MAVTYQGATTQARQIIHDHAILLADMGEPSADERA